MCKQLRLKGDVPIRCDWVLFYGQIGKDKGACYEVLEVTSITLRSLKNGELRKDKETRILKTFTSETSRYLPVMLAGEAKGEES